MRRPGLDRELHWRPPDFLLWLRLGLWVWVVMCALVLAGIALGRLL